MRGCRPTAGPGAARAGSGAIDAPPLPPARPALQRDARCDARARQKTAGGTALPPHASARNPLGKNGRGGGRRVATLPAHGQADDAPATQPLLPHAPDRSRALWRRPAAASASASACRRPRARARSAPAAIKHACGTRPRKRGSRGAPTASAPNPHISAGADISVRPRVKRAESSRPIESGVRWRRRRRAGVAPPTRNLRCYARGIVQ